MKLAKSRFLAAIAIFFIGISSSRLAYSFPSLSSIRDSQLVQPVALFCLSAAATVGVMFFITRFFGGNGQPGRNNQGGNNGQDSVNDTNQNLSGGPGGWWPLQTRPRPKHGELLHACWDDDLDRVKLLVRQGADVNERGAVAPLHAACRVGNLEIVKYLVKHGASINCNFHGFDSFPVNYACKYGHIAIVKYLINQGAKTDTAFDRSRILFDAIKYDEDDTTIVLEYLLKERGIDPNRPDRLKFTPLYEALDKNRLRCAQILVDYGADFITFKGNEMRETMENVIAQRNLSGPQIDTFKRQITLQKELHGLINDIVTGTKRLEDEIITISNCIRNPQMPPYAKLSMIAFLADAYIAGADIFETLNSLMRHVQFNFRFFNDPVLKNALRFALRYDLQDQFGRTALQAAPVFNRDEHFVSEIAACRDGHLLYTHREAIKTTLRTFENNRRPDLMKDVLKGAKEKRRKKLFRATTNAKFIVEDLQKDLIVKNEQNEEVIFSGFSPELAGYINSFVGDDNGKQLFGKKIQQEINNQNV